MVELEHESFLALRHGAQVIEADQFGDKVLALGDGSYLKLFRRKRLLSSAAWYPYAQRFADNAQALATRGVPCPEVVSVYRIPAVSRDAVHYRPLAGRSLRQLVKAEDVESGKRFRFGSFVARLHRLGVYFRSLHLGNVVLTPGGEFGLIDLADMKVKDRPLRKQMVDRNMRHLFRLEDDRVWLISGGGRPFLAGYASASDHLPDLQIRAAAVCAPDFLTA